MYTIHYFPSYNVDLDVMHIKKSERNRLVSEDPRVAPDSEYFTMYDAHVSVSPLDSTNVMSLIKRQKSVNAFCKS